MAVCISSGVFWGIKLSASNELDTKQNPDSYREDCAALNRYFCQPRVIGWLFSSVCQVVYLRSTFSLTKNSFTEVHLMYEYLSLSYF